MTVLILTTDHTQKDRVRLVVSFLDPSIKNNMASILKSTRVHVLLVIYRCATVRKNSFSSFSGKTS